MRKLEEITAEFGVAHKELNKFTKQKSSLRDEFLEVVDNEIKLNTSLATQSILLPTEGLSDSDIEKLALKKNPGWKVISIRHRHREDKWAELVLEEDPIFIPYTFHNEEDGYIYSKQVASGSVLLDDDLLQEEDPDFWNEITEEVVTTTRKMKSVDDLTPDQLARLDEYSYEGKKQVRVAAPKKANAK